MSNTYFKINPRSQNTTSDEQWQRFLLYRAALGRSAAAVRMPAPRREVVVPLDHRGVVPRVAARHRAHVAAAPVPAVPSNGRRVRKTKTTQLSTSGAYPERPNRALGFELLTSRPRTRTPYPPC
jgi:hypothetical protein